WTHKDSIASDSVFTVHLSRDGSLWAGTLNAGVSHLRNGRLIRYTTVDGLASNSISSILETSDGVVWVGTPAGLNAGSHGQWRVFRMAEGLPSEEVNCLLEDSTGSLWIGSSRGLAVYGSGRMENVGTLWPPLRDQIL